MKSILTLLAIAALSIGSAFAVDPVVLTPAAVINFSPGGSLSGGQTKLFTLVPAQAETLNGNGNAVQVGTTVRLEITSSGTTTYRVSFGANFTGIGSLDTGGVTGITWMLDFLWDGTNFVELSRIRQGAPLVVTAFVTTTTTLKWSDGVKIYQYTPTAAVTLAIDVVGRTGASFVLQLIGDGTGRAVTPGTNVKITTATVSSSADTNSVFVTFLSDGVSWNETSRTVATAASADDNT